MIPNRYLLDTSALLTLIGDEEGADRVQEIIEADEAVVPWMALLEVHYITRQGRGLREADLRYAQIQQLPVRLLLEMDEPTLLTASRFKAEYPLSLADALIAASASLHDCVLLHKDPEYESLSEQIEQELLPYKQEPENE